MAAATWNTEKAAPVASGGRLGPKVKTKGFVTPPLSFQGNYPVRDLLGSDCPIQLPIPKSLPPPPYPF